MQVSDVAAWAAAGVAIVSAVVSMGNAKSAKRQATAAENALTEFKAQTILTREANEQGQKTLAATVEAAEAAQLSAEHAKEANDLTRQQLDRNLAEANAAAVSEARKIVPSASGWVA